MWDFKLYILTLLFHLELASFSLWILLLNALDPLLQNGLICFSWNHFYQFTQNTSLFFGIKFVLAIFFLILIRGGTPRYRYDYLTKLGWLKFLTLVIILFLITVLFFFLY